MTLTPSTEERPSTLSQPSPAAISRFDRLVLLFIAGVLALTAVFIGRGDRVGLGVTALLPADGTRDVATTMAIRVRFAQPLAAPDLSHPIITFDPPVTGTVRWEGDALVFLPDRPLQPDTGYTVTVAAGLASRQERVLLRPVSWQFRTGRPWVLFIGWEREGRDQLYAIDPAGRAPLRLTDEPGHVLDFAPRPDGTAIAYSAMRPDGGSDLWLVDRDGTNRWSLLDCPALACAGPRWAPDGRRLIYERRNLGQPGAPPGPPRLWWLDLATGQTVAVFDDSQWLGLGVRFSRDGRWLSYVSPLAQAVQLFDLATGQSQTVASQTGEPPVWRPDGTALLLTQVTLLEDSYGTHVIRLDLADGALANLSGATATTSDSTPDWSPDGRWIAFSRKPTISRDGRQIWLMRPDGSDAHPVTDRPQLHYRAPQWSPDGRYLLVEWFDTAHPSDDPVIGLLEIATGELRTLATPAVQAAWLP